MVHDSPKEMNVYSSQKTVRRVHGRGSGQDSFRQGVIKSGEMLGLQLGKGEVIRAS